MLAAQIQNLQPVPVPPKPKPQPPKPRPATQGGGGGGVGGNREIVPERPLLANELDVTDDLALLYTTENIAVYATVLDVQVVERGNLLIFIADFGEDPAEVNFIYVKPGEHRPIADPGFGLPGSKIVRLDEGLYAATVDTTGFQGGMLKWHFFSVGEPKSAFAEYPIEIKDREPGLL